MSRYDDDYDDEDERSDDDEVDDEGEGVRRSTSNPFSRPNSVRGAGLPQRPPPTQGGSVPSPIRSPGANPNLPNRPGNPPQGGAQQGGVQPFPRSPQNRGDQKDQGGDRSDAVNRALSSFGSKLGSDKPEEKRDNKPANRPNSPLPRGMNPPRPSDDDDDDDPFGGNAPSRFGGNKPQENRDNKPANRPTSPLPRGMSSRANADDEDDDDPFGGNAPSRFGGNKPQENRDNKPSGGSLLGGNTPSRFGGNKPEERRDNKPSGGAFGGLNNQRFGGGDKKEDKPSGGALGGLTSRFSGGNKKEDKPSGGPLGGLTSRFSGDKKDDKRNEKASSGLTSRFGGGNKGDDKPSGGALGGLTSRFGRGEKQDDRRDNKPSGGGPLGGLTSRFGGNKASDAKDERMGTFGGSRDQSSNRPSPLGGTLSRGAKPETSASAYGGTPTRSSYGAAAGGATRTVNKPAPSLGDRLKGLNPFGQKEEVKPTRARASKAPRVDQGGLSLDSKLDIIGVTLVLGSLVLLLSSLSPTKGALTESVNHQLSYVFGWGAMFVLVVTFAIGIWLILRHFGDEAPTISRTRLVGMGLLFFSLLVAAQFIDAFQYKVGANQDYLGTLKTVFLPIAYSLGRGGGWIGGEIYFLLLSNFGEIGGFLVLFIPIIVGLMLALKISAADLAMIVISNGRNFGDVLSRRRLRASALRAEKQQALALAAQQISVTKLPEPLPLAQGEPLVRTTSPALPAPAPDEIPRRIPITTAGRTSTVPFRAPELVETPTGETGGLGVPVPVAEKSGGLFSRVRAALPGTKSDDEVQPKAQPPAAEKASALRGRLFAGKAASAEVQPAAAPSATPLAQPELQPQMQAQPTTPAPLAPPVTAAPTHPAEPEETPRLGDLLRRQTAPPAPGGVQPFQRPPRPEVNGDGERKPAEVGASQRPPVSAATPSPGVPSPAQSLRQSLGRETPSDSARAAPSPAFGKPTDPPFAVPQRSAPAASQDVTPPPQLSRRPKRDWKLPDPAALLSTGVDQAPDHDMLLKRAHIIEETLSSFGAPGRVVDVRTGPVVTQFGVEPDYVPGRGGKKNRVKVGAIAALDKDLQLALGAKSIRIEAPVPGKGYVGVEVPNEKAEVVHLRDVLEAQEFKKIKSPLAIALGQGVDGTPVAGDLASMPHLLIAGTTGSGKSVLVNAIIAGLLLKNTPKQLKFIMVDPKRVELTQYNGVPHLIAPVVVELERTVSVLKWVTREMDERYRKFSNAAARNIEDYNKHLPATEEPMPYIVVIIDELADLMMLAPDETERVITRIAALARATGIHLVIATQRPSVDVVTGLIKANFPARVAFAVAANTDSRVILDQPGAERLLGRGDMLWMSGDSPAPVRLQGVYVSDNEIGNITRFWRGQMTEEDLVAASRPIGGSVSPGDSSRSENGSVIMRSAPPKPAADARPQVAFWDEDEDDDGADDEDISDGEDELYEQSVEMVRRLNKASVSLLQRRLRIGYTRAARLIDMMEERGIVGPATEGSKPREVLPVR